MAKLVPKDLHEMMRQFRKHSEKSGISVQYYDGEDIEKNFLDGTQQPYYLYLPFDLYVLSDDRSVKTAYDWLRLALPESYFMSGHDSHSMPNQLFWVYYHGYHD